MTTKMFWATMLASTCLIPASLQADGPLPTDPNVISGDVTITTPSGNQMVVQQSGAYGIVDWGSFSIANGFGVDIRNGSGATLNRVTGNDVSSIFGTLNATGSVYLVNQNGIVFGETGVVNTGGTFVASTLDIDNADFLNGGDNTFRGESDAYVLNLGSISSLGGDVAILAHNVVNEGTIAAPDGTVGLVVGREILMRDASLDDGLFSVRIGGSDTSVTDAGTIRAAAAELRANGGNVYALAGNTSGQIAATGVAKVKGRVFLTAGDTGQVKVDKQVKATGADGKGGQITVTGGTVEAGGTLDASGTSGGQVLINSAISTVFTGEVLAFGDGAANSGGFVEVSGRHLTFGGTVQTRGGTVLIDPDNIEISNTTGALLSGASLLTPFSIVSLLSTQDVIIQTTGGTGEAGTIAVNAEVLWSSTNSLTFLAHGDVFFNNSVQNNNATGGDLNVVAGWDGSTPTGVPFDASPFLAADLATQTLYGNNIGASYTLSGETFNALGIVYVRQASSSSITAIGARAGETRVFAGSILMGGGGNGFTQIGFNTQTSTPASAITGNIDVRSKGLIWLTGSITNGSASQIGHGGMYFLDSAAPDLDISGDISVQAVDNIILDGGTAFTSYAMIGHGSNDAGSGVQATGDRTGNITVTSLGDFSIEPGTSGSNNGAQIGHVSASGVLDGDVTLTSLTFDQDVVTSPSAGGISVLDVGTLSNATQGGTVTVISTDSEVGAVLNLVGSTGPAACECANINTLGHMIIQAGSDLALDSTFQFSNTGGGNLVLAAGRNFQNNSGADAFGTMKGFWRIFSTRPDENTGELGTLTGMFVLTNTVFDLTDPFATGTSGFDGNGLIYERQPLVTLGDVTMTYGDTFAFPSFEVTVDGISIDPAAWGFSLIDFFLSDSVSLSATDNINAGTYLSAIDIEWDFDSSIRGYDTVAFDLGDLIVNRATLTASIIGLPTKVYDGNDTAVLTSSNFSLDGFVLGENGSVNATSGTYDSANANISGPVGVSAVLAAGDFSADSSTDLANYILPTLATGDGSIDAAQITGGLTGALTKVYDGNDIADLTSAFFLSGFVPGEGATITLTTGSYDDANAGGFKIVTALLTEADYAPTGTTLLSNYILPTVLTGEGAINQATVTGSIIGTPTKVYDGNAIASLTSANFELLGFVGADGATVNQTVGTYASANASGTNLITANLTTGNFNPTGTTLLANYILPTSVTGNGAITQGTLVLGVIVGNPLKVYDGTNVATLTAANFLLSGFATGEGATITKTTGTYASANASGSNAVTVTLASTDFAATGSTNLDNYVLPTSVFGNGVITQAVLTGSIIGTPTKVYDGNAIATLTPANFQLLGFVAGEGATVTETAGSYGSANASGTNTVVAVLTAGDFTPTGTTLLANYVLPTTVGGAGVITQATVTGSIIGTPTKVYDGNAIATLTPANFQLLGFVAGQGATVTETAGTYATANASGTNLVTAILAPGDFTATGATLLANYILPTTVTGNGVISQATVTGSIIGTPTKVYDGSAAAALTAANFQLLGFVAGEGATVTETVGSYASPNASGTNLVTATLAAGDFTATGTTLLANYILPTTVTGNGVISQATVTGSIIGTPTKVYDGNAAATLTPANFQLLGFVAGEGATVTQTAGTYATANASSTNPVTANLAPGDFTATGTTLLANYILPTTLTGNGVISQSALITGSIIGTPTKVYDGNAVATLTAANFQLLGFVAGEGATVTETAGTYASANASGANTVTVALTLADYAATGATNLANYILPTTISGTGVISQATLTGALIGTPTKTYNGNTTATLTAANFQLLGFIAGEGATVTQTTGTYASANASVTNTVTATLAAGDFTGTGGTVMSNYILPTTVTGAGVIDRLLLTASIIGLPTKPFDGSPLAVLTSANFQLLGFVTGQGATVTQTQGAFATLDVGTLNTVNADLTASDFVANAGTILANYILPTTASGPGLIDVLPPEQPFIPDTRGLEVFETTPLGQPAGAATGLEVINAETTQRIMDEIQAGTSFCKALVRQEYVIDCLSDRLQSVADGLSAVGEYSEVRAALEDAAAQLHALALSNASAELAEQVARAAGRRSSRGLTAVATNALASANAQAAAIIETAGLVLLRSSSGSAERSVAFSQVAQVVNSTKVLLRSS